MGGTIDWILMRITDIFFNYPQSASTGHAGSLYKNRKFFNNGAYPESYFMARISKSHPFSDPFPQRREFIEAAKVSGLNSFHIVFSELLPNMASLYCYKCYLCNNSGCICPGRSFFPRACPFTSINWGVMLNFAVSQAGALYSSRSVSYLLAPIVCISLLQISSILFVRALEERCSIQG